MDAKGVAQTGSRSMVRSGSQLSGYDSRGTSAMPIHWPNIKELEDGFDPVFLPANCV